MELPVDGRRRVSPVTLNSIATGPDDVALVTAAQGGDRAALNSLLERHYDRIYAICRRLAGNDADAQDAAQEALIAISRGLPRYDGRATFKTWSYRVATNACLDELRRRGRRPTPSVVDEHPEMVDAMRQPDAPAMAEQLADRMMLDAALAELPEEFRAPIVLRDQMGLDYREISEVLDVAAGTVRSRISRGRKKLAEILTAGNQTPLRERPT